MALSPSDKRALIILGGVVGVALLVFIGMKVLGGGGDTTTAAAPVSGVSPVPASTGPSAGPATVAPVPPSGETGLVLSGRDYFSPLPILPTASLTPTSPTATPTSDASTCTDTTTIDGHDIKLDSVKDKPGDDVVIVTVDGAQSSAAQGDTFSRFYTVVTVDPATGKADFTYAKGSVKESFTLCI